MTLRAMLAVYERLITAGVEPAEAMREARGAADGAAWYEAKRAELRRAREAYGAGEEKVSVGP